MRGLVSFFDFLFPPRPTDLLVRGVTEDALGEKMEPVLYGDGTVTALLPYRDRIVHALIIETKYYGNKTATTLLAHALTEYLLEYLYEETAIEKRAIVLIPLPLSGKRKRERGYNQVEEVLREAAHTLPQVSIDTSLLHRVRHTSTQTSLSREKRRENVADAFTAAPLTPAYLYIVVDDVVTTGATLHEAVKALTTAGATEVRGLALAY